MRSNDYEAGLDELAEVSFDGLTSPALVVDLDRVERNLGSMTAAVTSRGAVLRPHAKTHKSVNLGRMQLEYGATGLTVATLSEAAMFAAAGFDDLFVAYPVWPAGDRLRMLTTLAATTRRLRLGVDSSEGAARVGAAVRSAGRPVEVLIEADCGGERSGVRSVEAALAVARSATEAGLDVVGVFTHGGHSYRTRDGVRAAADDEVLTLHRYGEALRNHGYDVRELSAGSTPTSHEDERTGVTEERPGTYVFNDRLQVRLGACGWSAVALTVQATVVSVGRDHVIIDAGAKVLSSDLPAGLEGYGVLPRYPAAVISRLYDHHGVVLPGDGPRPRLGETVVVVPNHVCPVVNLADQVQIVSGGKPADPWPVDGRGLVT
ncbi:alanine racemase [Kribbella sp. NBC_00709]|uniref:alanine racemase n=1 Tax=Kribbella sp. NBC_00709 TaxID=2975972 RepID=UPI002E2AA8FE|nr:alanine racemase [Kribbella sp. NBC_00709]